MSADIELETETPSLRHASGAQGRTSHWLEGERTICICFVDLRILGKFAVRFQVAGLIGCVLQDNVALLILIVAQGEQDDISLVDPHLTSHE